METNPDTNSNAGLEALLTIYRILWDPQDVVFVLAAKEKSSVTEEDSGWFDLVWESTFCLDFHGLDLQTVQAMPCSHCQRPSSWVPTTPQSPRCCISPVALGGIKKKKKKWVSSLSKHYWMYLASIFCLAAVYQARPAVSHRTGQSPVQTFSFSQGRLLQMLPRSDLCRKRDGECPCLT